MLPNASGFGPASACVPGSAFGSAVLDCASLAIGLLAFLVGTETKRGSAAVLDCDGGVELTTASGWVEDAGRVVWAVTKPFVGWMLLTLNPPVTSLPGLGAEGSEV